MKPAFLAAGRFGGVPAAGGDSGELVDIAITSGSSAFTVAWEEVADAEGYVICTDAATQTYDDFTLYAWRKIVAGGSTLTYTFTSVVSGTKYVRVAAYQDGLIGPLSTERSYTPS